MWLAFVFAATVLLIIPGPTIILVISQSLAHGRSAVLPLTAGVTLGDFTAMSLSFLGLGAVLASSSAAFTVLKWTGAVYLVFLGLRLWLSKPETGGISTPGRRASSLSLFRSALVVTAMNPKSIAFFVAFLPQFINTQDRAFPQFLLLGSTFLMLAALNATLYGVFAGRLRDGMQNPKIRRCFDLCGGSALIAAGVATASVVRRSSG
jgi:threonine/homoserine/homoserine lactone efflux protein